MSKKKHEIFPVIFNENNKPLLEWLREQASKEDRSMSNYIVTKLKEVKERNDREQS